MKPITIKLRFGHADPATKAIEVYASTDADGVLRVQLDDSSFRALSNAFLLFSGERQTPTQLDEKTFKPCVDVIADFISEDVNFIVPSIFVRVNPEAIVDFYKMKSGNIMPDVSRFFANQCLAAINMSLKTL